MDAGRGLTLANDPVQWGERVETYGYSLSACRAGPGVPDYSVIFEEQTTTVYERTVIFERAHHLDVALGRRCRDRGGHWLSINRLPGARGAGRSC